MLGVGDRIIIETLMNDTWPCVIKSRRVLWKIINPIAFVGKERSMRPAGAKEYVMRERDLKSE